MFGFWSDKRNFGEVLAVSLGIGVIANVTYAVSYANWMLLLARFLVGFGNGNNSILNSYLACTCLDELASSLLLCDCIALMQITYRRCHA